MYKFSKLVVAITALFMDQSCSVIWSAKFQQFGELWQKKFMCAPWPVISLRFCIQESLGLPRAFWGPTDRVGDSFNFFVHPLSKLCCSDAHLRVREKHAWPFPFKLARTSILLAGQNRQRESDLWLGRYDNQQ